MFKIFIEEIGGNTTKIYYLVNFIKIRSFVMQAIGRTSFQKHLGKLMFPRKMFNLLNNKSEQVDYAEILH